MTLLSCCRSTASSKSDVDDYNYHSTVPCANSKRIIRPKPNVVASSESLGPLKSVNSSAFDDTKGNQDRKSPRVVAFTLNAGSTESTLLTSNDLYNQTDNPVTISQWMDIFEESKNQARQQNGSQSAESTAHSSCTMSTTASSTCVGSSDCLTMCESAMSINNDDDDDGQSPGRRLPVMHSLGVLPTHAVTLSRQASDCGPTELAEKCHSVAYLTENPTAARESVQRTPPLLRSAEVEDIPKKLEKFSVHRSPELEDLSHIESDSE